MEPVYYRPYLVYHKNHDENNLVMVPYETGICHTKDSARTELVKFVNKFFSDYANHKYRIRIRTIDGFPYIMKRVKFGEVVIGYTNIGYVYQISNGEYSYLGFVVKRVGNTFRVYDDSCYKKFIGLSTIDIDEIRALNEALNIIDNIFHSRDHIRSILNTEVERKAKDVY